ncbi:MAG: N-formylglutamate amidohydrolase [Pseudomonadales bacterium]|nr:N-formylglutamate amidohydrolase [Pseudomonadales bacterium]
MPDIKGSKVAKIINRHGDSPFFIICEHASSHIPDCYKNLGLTGEQVQRHIGWDIGAEQLARNLALILNAPLVLQTHSRLLYDCNRPPSAASAIVQMSDGTEIPGNKNLSASEKRDRADDIYVPFHRSITELLDQRATKSRNIIVTIHSFNPILQGVQRQLDIGFINAADPSWAETLAAAGQQYTELSIKQNQPYSSADGVTHTLEIHGSARDIENVMIEVKNTLISDAKGQRKFATILADLLRANL